MKVLVVTARKVRAGVVEEVLTNLAIAGDVELSTLSVAPPATGLPLTAAHVVGRSRIGRRPAVPVAVGGAGGASGWRRVWARLHRAAERAAARVPVPDSWRISAADALDRACSASPDVRRLAEAADVVVSFDARASYSVWLLARRVDGAATGTVFVNRPRNVRDVLAGHGVAVPASVPERSDAAATGIPRFADLAQARRRLLIGPADFAGQAREWSRAAGSHLPGTRAVSFSAVPEPRGFAVDYRIDATTFAGDLRWRLAWRERVIATFTHVLVEANRPLLGAVRAGGVQHAEELLTAGLGVGMLAHGSDVRIPSVHAARERWHPYDALPAEVVRTLESGAQANVAAYERFAGPVFVSTPGLLEFLPDATWLPVTVDVARWRSEHEPLRREVPVVTHVPSGPQKGSHLIDPVLRSLADRGVIGYRRVEGVSFDEMPEIYGTADIVIDQFGLADYGVAACEAMAAGRIVVSRVADEVRSYVREQTGADLPVVEANPGNLEQVILGLLADRDQARVAAAAGPEFVSEVHDGRRAAAVLGAWLG